MYVSLIACAIACARPPCLDHSLRSLGIVPCPPPLADPASIPGASTALIETVRSVVQQLGDTDAAHSPLWKERSLQRRIEVARAPFGPTRDAAR